MPGMDPATSQRIDEKISEYAEELPESQREDFAQDMWVILLGVELPTGGALTGFLNLTLFRARENWKDRKRFHEPVLNAVEASTVEDPEAVSAETTLEAVEAMHEVANTLTEAGFSKAEIAVVMEGLRDGLTQKDIAVALGRTPQGLNYHMKKLRAA
jgi:hypothetical protein